MGTIITISVVFFVIYIIYKIIFIRSNTLVQDIEIGIKSKQIYSNPDNAKLYAQRGLKFLQRAGNYLQHQDLENATIYYDKALDDFDTAIDINPKLAEAYYYKGIILWVKKDDIGAYYTLLEAEKLGYYKATQFIKDQGMR